MQHSNMGLVIVTRKNEGHLFTNTREMLSIDSLFLKHYFGFRSCIFSMTGEDQNLIIVFIRRIVVDHGCHSQLETTVSIVREMQSSYLFDIFFIFVPGIDRAQNVENNDADHRQINGFVLREISIGENIVPVHWGR